jgi:flagella basal body P-ring formation protein FlgA
MRLRSFLTLAIGGLLLPISPMHAESGNFEDIEELRAKILLYAEDHFRRSYGEQKFARDVKLRISQLDQRLQLTRCDKNIRFELIQPAHQSRNITIKTNCDAQKRWSIYVPLTLEVYDNVIVAARSLGRGTVISEADLKLSRVDTASLPIGYVVDKTRVLGMELKRATRDGSYLLLSSLESPRVVNKGDSVVLEARLSSSLTVAAKGTALDHGQVGEQIKVRNNQSERVVDALVTGPGHVTVVSR